MVPGAVTRSRVMSPLREAVLLQMRLRGFAVKTVEAYIYAMEQLYGFHRRPRRGGRSPERLPAA